MKYKILLFAAAIFMTHTASAITPANGWWWNPAEPGRGLNLEMQRGKVFIAVFVYDEQGSPVWYSGAGELKDSAVTVPLQRYDGGQCPGCAYTAPDSGDVATVTIKFSSPTHGILTWSGGSVKIERFNYALGKGLERLLGEWAITIGSPSSTTYFGERLAYREVNTTDGMRVVNGSVSGDPGNWSTVSAFSNPETAGYQYLGIVNSSTPYYDFYAFSFAGLNKIIGKTVTLKKTTLPKAVARSLVNGSSFVAYRNLGKNAAADYRVTAQSLPRPKDDSIREAIDVLSSSLQNPQYTTLEGSDDQHKKAIIDIITSKIYAMENRLAR